MAVIAVEQHALGWLITAQSAEYHARDHHWHPAHVTAAQLHAIEDAMTSESSAPKPGRKVWTGPGPWPGPGP